MTVLKSIFWLIFAVILLGAGFVWFSDQSAPVLFQHQDPAGPDGNLAREGCLHQIKEPVRLTSQTVRPGFGGTLIFLCRGADYSGGPAPLLTDFLHLPEDAGRPLANELDAILDQEGPWFAYPTRRRNRYGLPLFKLANESGDLLSLRLVQQGVAAVVPYAAYPDEALYSQLRREETKAKADARGIWALTALMPYSTTDTYFMPTATWVRTVGRAASVNLRRKYLFINFGKDWSSDATAVIDRQSWERMEEAGLSLDQLRTACLEITGRWGANKGPYMRITHRDQIQFHDQCLPTRENRTEAYERAREDDKAGWGPDW